MPRKSDIPLRTITIKLYDGDTERLRDFYPAIGYNAVIRELVRHHLSKLDAIENETIDHDTIRRLAAAAPIPVGGSQS